MAVTDETINKYGDKFSDGTRTLAYSKVTEPVVINRFDELEQDFVNLRKNITNRFDSIDGSINSLDVKLEDKINNLGAETARVINEVRDTVNTDMRIMNEHLRADDVKLNMIWITIYHILQIWPLRFLNKIFKWWTYQVINEEYLADGKEYIFYVTIILRGDKTRKQMNEYTKAFETRVKESKEMQKKNNNLGLTYTIKPNFPDMYVAY